MHDMIFAFSTALRGLPVPAPYAPLVYSVITVALLWALAIKGIALWFAARNSQRNWFIALLIINSVGILELVYLFGFRTRDSQAPGVSSDRETPDSGNS